MALKRKFIEIEIPLIEESISVLGSVETLKNKTIKLDLTRKLRGKGLEITFKILKKGEKLIGVPKKIKILGFYIRRMMRKRVNYVEDSIKAECKDLRSIIKPFFITRKKVSRAVRKNLRNTAQKFLLDYLKDKKYVEICEKILRGELQKSLLPKLKKVYPLSFCDIRVFEILKSSDLSEDILEKKIKKEIEEETKKPKPAEESKENPEKTKKSKTSKK
jgi:ribosomal protein S3AE